MWIVPNNHPIYFLYAQGTGESREVLEEQLEKSPSSLMWRSKPSQWRTWSTRWKRGGWLRRLSGRILKLSTQKSFEDMLIYSLGAIPVSLSAQPDQEEAQKTPGTYGPSSQILSETVSQGRFFSRMSKDISASGLPKSSPIWKKWVIGLRSEYSLRLKSALLIKEKESSSWLTKALIRKDGKDRLDNLDAVVRFGHRDQVSPSKIGKNPELFQTPKASDAKSPGKSRDVHLPHQTGGPSNKLNPDWVEQLMGLPVGASSFTDGSNRVDRLRLLGNGVVPQVAEKAYNVLSAKLKFNPEEL